MHRQTKVLISIWFFIGVLLLVYGVLILGAGLYELSRRPNIRWCLPNLHAAIWWGACFLCLVAFILIRFFLSET